MKEWIYLIGFYLWLGFTVGYFFRKWLEVSYLPRYREEEREDKKKGGGG